MSGDLQGGDDYVTEHHGDAEDNCLDDGDDDEGNGNDDDDNDGDDDDDDDDDK